MTHTVLLCCDKKQCYACVLLIGLPFADSSLMSTIFLFNRWAKGINHPEWTQHPQGGLQSHNTVDELITEAHIFWLSQNSALNSHRFMHFSENDSFKSDFEKFVYFIKCT